MSRITLSLISKMLLIGGWFAACLVISPPWLVSIASPDSASTPNTIQDSERLLLLLAGSAAPNSRGRLPVVLNSLGNENSLSFSLSFDPAVLGDPKVELESDYAEAFLEVNRSQVEDGRLGIRLILPDGGSFKAGVRNILRVNFAIAPEAGAGPAPVEMGDAPVVRRIRDEDGNILPGRYGAGTMTIVPGIEADVAISSGAGNVDGEITEEDWQRIGLFAVASVTPEIGSEFQRADCAPRAEKGDGRLTVADWVQARRFLDGMDEPVAAGGPSVPADPVSEPMTPCVPGSSPRVLRINDAVFLRGMENRLEVGLDSSGEENAIGFTLSFDPTQLKYVRTIVAADAEDATLNINSDRAAQGMIGIGMALPSGRKFASGARQVLSVFFSVPSTSPANQTTVSFDDSPAAREVVDESATVLCADFAPGIITFMPEVNEPPTLTSLDPPVVFAGATNLTLLVNGGGFVTASVARANGEVRETEFISGKQLRVTLLPLDVAGVGTVAISVMNPGEGGGVSNPLELFVVQRAPGDNLRPSLFGITPMEVLEGRSPFTLKLTGNAFARNAIVRVKGQDRMTRFVSETQLEVTVSTADVAAAVEVAIQVVNPPPGGGTSNELKLLVKKPNPLPRITSLSLEENPSGGFTLTVNGLNFVSGAEVRVNGSSRSKTFVSASKLTVNLSAQELATAGTLIVIVVNPALGGGKSLPFSLIIGDLGLPPNKAPILFSITPNMVAAGSREFLLKLSGSDFLPGSVVLVGNRARVTNFVSSSQLTAEIPASDVAKAASLAVQVANPDSGGGKSSAATLEVKNNNPDPRIASITLNKGSAGQSSSLLVSGVNFIQTSIGRVNGSSRSTSFVSNTTLRITLAAQDQAAEGTLEITVFNPPPGGGVSNTFSLVIDDPAMPPNPPAPSISSIRPSLVGVGGAAFTLIVNGSNFRRGAVVLIKGRARATKFVNASQLTAVVFPSDIAVPGNLSIEVLSPEGVGRSGSTTLAVKSRNPVTQITSINPDMAFADGKDIQLKVFGVNFVNGSAVYINGANRSTSFISNNELSATIFGFELSGPGSINISVVTASPGGGVTRPISLVVERANPKPSISCSFPKPCLIPNPLLEGSSSFTLKVSGSGFMIGSVIQIEKGRSSNGAIEWAARPTNFISNTQLTAEMAAADAAKAGNYAIRVLNPEPGGGPSNSMALEVKKRNPLPRIASLSTDVVQAGSAGFILTVNGSNFVSGASVRVKRNTRSATFVSSTQLSVQINSSDIALPGLVGISVVNPAPSGGSNTFLLIAQ